jgi:hypothetical protein
MKRRVDPTQIGTMTDRVGGSSEGSQILRDDVECKVLLVPMRLCLMYDVHFVKYKCKENISICTQKSRSISFLENQMTNAYKFRTVYDHMNILI